MTATNRKLTLQMILVVTGIVITVGSFVVGALPIVGLGSMFIVAGLILAFSRWLQRRRATV